MYLRCNQFGFDRKRIDQHLAFLRLSKADHKLAQQLNREVITPYVDQIVDRFYEDLLFHPASRKWLLDGEIIERLKTTQRQYLLTLGIDFDSEAYFENRLQIGVVHAAVKLPLNVYQCAYCNLTQHIMDAFPPSITENAPKHRLISKFVIKITSLDMSLAIETYHYSFMRELEHEIQEAHTRGEVLQDQAERDSLTGLYNRKYVFSHLTEAIGSAQQYSEELSLLMLDVDHFKKVNDTYGHQAGDEVLRQVAVIITESLRVQDILGRYGGEEFILGLRKVTPQIAFKIADRIRNLVASTPVSFGETTMNVTVSIGLTSLGPEDNLNCMIKRADDALYTAKSTGRNCVINI